jgi:hypothetical protein
MLRFGLRFEALRFGCEIRFKICDLSPEIQICKQIDLRFKTAIRFEICPSLPMRQGHLGY